MDFSPLRHAMQALGPLPDGDWALLVPLVVPRKMAAGQHLLRAGERATQAYFVREGLLREYYTDLDGAEATRRFCQPGELSGSLADLLREAAPEGIDVYFDNVGGDHLEAALGALRRFGRVVMCGTITEYDLDAPLSGPRNLFFVVAKELTIRGLRGNTYA